MDCYILSKDAWKAVSVVEFNPVGLLGQEDDREVDRKVLAAFPGRELILDDGLLTELRDSFYALVAPVPGVHTKVGNILPKEAAYWHIQGHRDDQPGSDAS